VVLPSRDFLLPGEPSGLTGQILLRAFFFLTFNEFW
jgi:hypothetical protein